MEEELRKILESAIPSNPQGNITVNIGEVVIRIEVVDEKPVEGITEEKEAPQ